MLKKFNSLLLSFFVLLWMGGCAVESFHHGNTEGRSFSEPTSSGGGSEPPVGGTPSLAAPAMPAISIPEQTIEPEPVVSNPPVVMPTPVVVVEPPVNEGNNEAIVDPAKPFTQPIAVGPGPILNYSIPSNQWQKITPKIGDSFAQAGVEYLPKSKGFNNSIYRSATGDIVFYDGVKGEDRSPGFYTNAIVSWNIYKNTIELEKATNFGGSGSSGGGKLLSGYADDIGPAPRHTYDGFAYIDKYDGIVMQLGASWRNGANGATEAAIAELEIDSNSTWFFHFSTNKWYREQSNVRFFWSNVNIMSDYESHLRYWPEQDMILFMDATGTKMAGYSLASNRWILIQSFNKPPASPYNALSTWDSLRQRWVFRNGTSVWFYDPNLNRFESLPDCGIEGKDITYISRYDVYLVAGTNGSQTKVYSPLSNTWNTVNGGNIDFSGAPYIYIEYDRSSDVVGMVTQGGDFYQFRYQP